MRRPRPPLARRSLASLVTLAVLFAFGAAWAVPKPKGAGAPDAAAHAAASASASAAPSASSSTSPSASTSPSTSTAPAVASTPPPPSSSAAPPPAPPPTPADVRVHDRKVFTLRVARAGASPKERADKARQALERALTEDVKPADVHVVQSGDAADVFAGERPIVELGPDDAAAEGGVSLAPYAESVALAIRSTVAAERQRSEITSTVLWVSLLVLIGLAALFALRKLGELIDKGRRWVDAHPDSLPHLRVAGVEVLRAAYLRSGLLVTIDVAQWLLRLTVAYLWLVFALTRFDVTRDYGERLGGIVLAPIWALVGRTASALPELLVAGIAAVAVGLLVRFVGLFFASVARGETQLAWLPPDLAAPTSLLTRAGIILLALMLAAPLLTGSDEGALARAGLVALVAVGLACAPLLASAAVGVVVVFGRRLRTGDFVEVGGREGVVRSVSLFEVVVEDPRGGEVRIPHLASLVHATHVLGAEPPVTIELVIAPTAPHARVVELLKQTAAPLGARPVVELLHLDADGARYEVTVHTAASGAKTRLYCAAADALTRGGIALGRSGKSA